MFRGSVWVALVGTFAVACGGDVGSAPAGRGGEAGLAWTEPVAGSVGVAGTKSVGHAGDAGSIPDHIGGAGSTPADGGGSAAGAPQVGGGSSGGDGAEAGAPAAGSGGVPGGGGGDVSGRGGASEVAGESAAGAPSIAGSPAGGSAGSSTCVCSSGPCCDGCNLRPSTYRCGTHMVHTAKCPPEGPSHLISYQYGDLFCSGNDAECTNWVDTTFESTHCAGNDVCHNPASGTPYCGPL